MGVRELLGFSRSSREQPKPRINQKQLERAFAGQSSAAHDLFRKGTPSDVNRFLPRIIKGVIAKRSESAVALMKAYGHHLTPLRRKKVIHHALDAADEMLGKKAIDLGVNRLHLLNSLSPQERRKHDKIISFAKSLNAA